MVVERYLDEVLKRHELDALERLVSDPTLKQRARLFLAAFPDLAVQPTILLAEGDLVAVHLSGRGTHEGLFQGCPATGRSWTATCTAIYRVDAGRIVESRVNWDLLAVMEQLGVVRRATTVSA